MKQILLKTFATILIAATWSIHPPGEIFGQKKSKKVKIEPVSLSQIRVNFIIDSFMRKHRKQDSLANFVLTSAKEVYLHK